MIDLAALALMCAVLVGLTVLGFLCLRMQVRMIWQFVTLCATGALCAANAVLEVVDKIIHRRAPPTPESKENEQ
ncbi:hypothetical protein [Ramlibacter sp.]|uniref:hypothetical protein n=1 Tax=Ramlibacter sp. TaxID=1917967 RepID=UPI002B6BF3C8|nr:hypothetical protein [Ramlibacter sp.]HWI83839.1 hypothetical protein [Ramlibacter sp.]